MGRRASAEASRGPRKLKLGRKWSSICFRIRLQGNASSTTSSLRGRAFKQDGVQKCEGAEHGENVRAALCPTIQLTDYACGTWRSKWAYPRGGSHIYSQRSQASHLRTCSAPVVSSQRSHSFGNLTSASQRSRISPDSEALPAWTSTSDVLSE